MMNAPLLLFWDDAWIDVEGAESMAAGRYQLSTLRADFDRADAVIFPVPTMGQTLPPQRAFPGQLLVVWSQESVVHFPHLLHSAYNELFDLRMTYELDSDVPIPYATADTFDGLGSLVPVADREEVLVSAWMSSTWDRCGRNAYLLAMMQHLPTHSYGKVGHNRDLAEDHGEFTKLATIGRYGFTVAFENSIANDYVTEKFFQPLRVGSVPIYRGAPNIADFSPAPHCYVDASDFAGPGELAEFLRSMTDDEYASYHEWRDAGPTPQWRARFTPFATPTFVRLARAVEAIRFGRRVARSDPQT